MNDARRFTANETFWSDELRMQFETGLSYEPRDEDTVLRELIPKWLAEGKIREGGPISKLSGTGAVK